MKHHSLYRPPQRELWKGRASDPELGIQYWHQVIECLSIEEIEKKQPDLALIGYACDEGVRRNLGRVGAKEAPNLIKGRLAKLPYHANKKIIDVGNVLCHGQDLEGCQEAFASVISTLIKKGVKPIGIGGGHDIAYAHLKGIIEGLAADTKIGIVNFDAHFDLRVPEGQATSGTPFSQVLSEHGRNMSYLALGIQQSGNIPQLFEIANELKVNYIFNYKCIAKHLADVKTELASFAQENDHLYITIDMDGFASPYAPGVSAPSALGFDPFFVMECLSYLLSTKKVIACDIAETNPLFDQDGRTVDLAARLIDFIICQY